MTTDVMERPAPVKAGPSLLKIAFWTGSLGVGAYLLRRFLNRRQRRIDVGAVSDDWLASQRRVADEFPY